MSHTAPRAESLAATALEAANAATDVHRKHLGRIHVGDAVDKGTYDFVSEVDLEAQEAALAVILRAFPDHRILAEEDGGADCAGAEAPEAPLWIVDPLDGTTNFLHGHPAFCASVGVLVDGRPVAGAVVAAVSGERYTAWEGGGAWLDTGGTGAGSGADSGARGPVRIRVSGLAELRQALAGTGFPFKRPDEIPGYLEQLGRMLRRSSGVRRDGSAALDLCLLARGTFDVFWEGTLAPWDVAGGLAVLAEAGGAWSAPEGAAFDIAAGGPLRAANGDGLLEALHGALREPVDVI
ncbi:MAG: inositol monophosphatase [Gemmatimonadales bacterium]|nr:MAG: inositol monophosphatase [Gemmatimonadales bacterium]